MSRRLPLQAAAAAVALTLVPGPAWAFSLLEKADPQVEQANRDYASGNYEKALEGYEAATRDRPDSAALQFNRGNALHKLGKNAEAKDAYTRALTADDQNLKARDLYNLGNALAAMKQNDEAIRAYRKSLRLEPQNADARHNLEVLLLDRDRPKGPKDSPDGGTGDGGRPKPPDSGNPDAGPPPDAGMDAGAGDGGSPNQPDGGQDGGGSDGGASDGGRDGGTDAGADGGGNSGTDGGRDGGGLDGGASDGGRDGGMDGGARDSGSDDGSSGRGADGGADGGDDGGSGEMDATLPDGGELPPQKPVSEQEAERLLDSMRRNEKNLQMWKFKPKVRNNRHVDKDW